MSEKPKSIVEYNIRNIGLPSVRKYIGNGDTIVAFAGHNCQLWAKSGSRLLQNTSNNLCCRWTHIHSKFYYRTFSSKAHPFLEKDWENRATVPVDFVNFQNDCVNWKEPIKRVYKFMLNERMFEIAEQTGQHD